MKIREFSNRLQMQGEDSTLASLFSLSRVPFESLMAKAIPDSMGWVPWPAEEEQQLALRVIS